MKKLFLSSEIDVVAKHIAKKLDRSASDYKAVFISTAGEPVTDDKQWMEDNKQGLVDIGLNVFDYTITAKKPKDIEKDLKGVDWIHVNGGNTFYLLLQARKSGFDKYISKVVERDIIYSGSSAGSIIASPNIEIAKKLEHKLFAKELKSFEGFNLVDFIILPHWGRKDSKDLYLNHRLSVAYKKGNKIILLNDDQYVQVEGDRYRIVDIGKD